MSNTTKSDLPDLVYVDLIEDEPMTRAEFEAEARKALDVDEAEELDQPALDTAYKLHLEHFQPFRWHAQNGGNHKIGAVGERYFNEADAIANIEQQYSLNTMVYLRRAEHGNQLLRSAYPLDQGEIIQIGPQCFAQADGSVLNWKGVNYIPAPEPDSDPATWQDAIQGRQP